MRDNHTCLITGEACTRARTKAAHIFPRSFDAEWIAKGFKSQITDPEPYNHIGGHLKIDSIQNVILLRTDLHYAWNAYEIGIDVMVISSLLTPLSLRHLQLSLQDDYKVIAFVDHYNDIHGKRLHLGHILDPDIRPLDTLLRDHFEQCVFRNMCGAEEDRDEFDFELDPFEPYSLDLSDTSRWTSSKGQHLFEHALRDRLFDQRVAQEV